MKNFFKYYLPLLIFFGASGIFLLIYMFENHNVVLRYIAGELGLERSGKIISTKVNAIVKDDGIEKSQVELFEDNGQIYMVSPKIDNSGYAVLIIDKERKNIFVPINNCHELLFSKYLIQAECGQRGDYYSGEKHEGYQVKLESNDSQINFQLPVYSYGKYVKLERNRKMEIIFKGE